MENSFIIDISNFSLSYGSVQLFNNFNLHVKKGECVGISGPTGTGKTSLLNKIVCDYIKIYKIAYVFQDNRLLEDISVKKNIMIPLKNILKKEECEKVTSDILKLVNLEYKINNKTAFLSGGEHQRLNIARAFAYGAACPCDILIMDEPFSAQDNANRSNLIKLTKKICEENKITSLVVSYNRDDLIELCSYIVEL